MKVNKPVIFSCGAGFITGLLFLLSGLSALFSFISAGIIILGMYFLLRDEEK